MLVDASELGSRRPVAAARSRRTGTEVEVAIAPAQHSDDDGRCGLCTLQRMSSYIRSVRYG